MKISRNNWRGGIEVRFGTKPSATLRAELHRAGFKWSPEQQLWWARVGTSKAEAWVRSHGGPLSNPAPRARRTNGTPKAWRAKGPSRGYPCKSRYVGKTVRLGGRPATVTACATPARRAPKVGQFRVRNESGDERAVPRKRVHRAAYRAKHPRPPLDRAAPPWQRKAVIRRGSPLPIEANVDVDGVPYAVTVEASGTAAVYVWDGFEWAYQSAATYDLQTGTLDGEDISIEAAEALGTALTAALVAAGAPPPDPQCDDACQRRRGQRARRYSESCGRRPVFTSTAARTAWLLGSASECASRAATRGKSPAARSKADAAQAVATAAEQDVCGENGDLTSRACEELYDAYGAGCTPGCSTSSVPCDRRITTRQVEAWEAGDETPPIHGPYETRQPHTAGGSPCCWYHPDTQERLRLQRRVETAVYQRNRRATPTQVAEAILQAEREHPLAAAWELCDARAMTALGRNTEFRDVLQAQVDTLKRVVKKDRITQADMKRAGLSSDSPDEAREALAAAERDLAVVTGRPGARRSTGMRRHRAA